MYGAGQAQAPISDAVLRMRRDIAVEFLAGEARSDNAVGGFKVSFESPNPTLAMKITERLTSLFVEENLRQREGQAAGMSLFLDAEIADVRRRLIELETSLEGLRARNRGGQVSQADLLPYDVLRERYKALLVRREDTGASPTWSGARLANSSKWLLRPGCPNDRSGRAGWA